MANTIIALKKSGTPGATPPDLQFGELGINYADGKLFYKNTNSQIAEISGQEINYFGSVNANGVLVIADTPSDILTIEAGNNIVIVGDAVNDKIIISATASATVTSSDSAPASPKDNELWWNTTEGKLYIYYNDGDSSQWVEASPSVYTITDSLAFDKANAANVLAFNTGIGANAYANLVWSRSNTRSDAIGVSANAFVSATIAGANTAVGAGANAFTSATIAGANVAVGSGANAYANLVWSRSNTYADTVGTSANAFTSATIAGANTAVGIGSNAFTSATVAGANTAVGAGANAYANLVWSRANTRMDAIGASANNWANTKLSNSTTTFAGTLTITGDSLVSGNVGIGITSPTSKLHVIGEANITSNLVVGGSVTAIDFNSVSDASLKENIDSITNSHQILSQINPVSFHWKNNGAKSYGILAQEVEQILPEIVATNNSGIKSVSYIQLIALLIDAVNTLQKDITTLKKQLPSNPKGVEDGKTSLHQDTEESIPNSKTRRRRSKKVGP